MRRALVACVLLLSSPSALADPVSPGVARVLLRAREEVARRVAYDPSYVGLSYPGGDVDPAHGVCTDVVIRALRAAGIDLQARVHEDVLARPRAYAAFVTRPDANIDHRRVGPILVWLEANATRLSVAPASFAPGDIVVWSLHGNGRPEHIGIASDRVGARGFRLVLHNIGPSPTEDDVLDTWQVLGHFRLPL